MNEEMQELGDRIEGLRLVLSILISSMPNRYDVIFKLQQAEALARQRNLPTGVLEELADLRASLDGL